MITWNDLLAETEPLDVAPVDAGHPLYVLYSSGTTGLPKPIVHGHAGVLVEHLKVIGLHGDTGVDDRLFWFTTTGWMMWNYVVSGLLVGARVVLYDGDPNVDGPDHAVVDGGRGGCHVVRWWRAVLHRLHARRDLSGRPVRPDCGAGDRVDRSTAADRRLPVDLRVGVADRHALADLGWYRRVLGVRRAAAR